MKKIFLIVLFSFLLTATSFAAPLKDRGDYEVNSIEYKIIDGNVYFMITNENVQKLKQLVYIYEYMLSNTNRQGSDEVKETEKIDESNGIGVIGVQKEETLDDLIKQMNVYYKQIKEISTFPDCEYEVATRGFELTRIGLYKVGFFKEDDRYIVARDYFHKMITLNETLRYDDPLERDSLFKEVDELYEKANKTVK